MVDGDVLLLLRDAGMGEVMESDALSFLGDSLFLLRNGGMGQIVVRDALSLLRTVGG